MPAIKNASARRRPNYISPFTAGFGIYENGTYLSSVSLSGPDCTAAAGGATTCTTSFDVNPGADQSFQINAESMRGVTLSAQTIVATIVAGQTNVLNFVLGGLPATLEVAIPQPLVSGVAGSTSVYVNALDESGQTILGPSPFSDANGNPIIVTLVDSDTSGATMLDKKTITSPGSIVTLSYNGGANAAADIFASTPSLSSTMTNAFACAKSVTSEFLATEPYESGNFEIVRFPLAGAGTAPTSEAPLTGTNGFYDSQFVTDGNGNIYTPDSTLGGTLDEYCATASGAATPISQFTFPTDSNAVNVNSFSAMTVDPAGDHIVASQQINEIQPKYYPTLLQGYGVLGTTMFGPLDVSGLIGYGPVYGVAAGVRNAYVASVSADGSVGTNGSPTTNSFEAGPGYILPIDSKVDAAGNLYVLYAAEG